MRLKRGAFARAPRPRARARGGERGAAMCTWGRRDYAAPAAARCGARRAENLRALLRLKELLRTKLIECGWRDELKEYCKGGRTARQPAPPRAPAPTYADGALVPLARQQR